MTETLTCPNGHPVLVQDASCPICQTVLQNEPIILPSSRNVPSIPGYEVMHELGRGGMGVVFKARQVSLNRLVALKMILGGSLVDSQEMARFRAEASAVARLQHTNIVQIFEVGDYHGVPFLSLEFVEGCTLAQYLRGVPQSPRVAARLVETLARAIHTVHDVNIIHRDLKPGNILLQSADGKNASKPDVKSGLPVAVGNATPSNSEIHDLQTAIPKITDFGLAKQLGGSGQLTPTGAVLGTPSYMAPEQALGKPDQIGPTTDVYALGAILYETLTGRPPFLGESAMHTIHQVLNDTVVPPRQLQPKLPKDLETICLKCLQRDPARRYPSALELAEDLCRFLEHKPIVARPVGRLERSWSWCKRHPGVAALTATVAFVLLTGTIVSLAFALTALERQNKLNHQLYVAKMGRIQKAWDDGQISRVMELLKEQNNDMRGFEWYYWQRLMERNIKPLPFAADETQAEIVDIFASQDGSHFAAVSNEGVVQGWEAAGHARTFTAKGFETAPGRLFFNADGKYLAGISSGALRVLNTQNEEVASYGNDITHLTLSPGGQHLACSSLEGNVFLLKIAAIKKEVMILGLPPLAIPTGEEALTKGPFHIISALAFSKDGQRLAVAEYENLPPNKPTDRGMIRIWDVNDGRLLQTLTGNMDIVQYLGFSADGKRLVSAARDQTLRLWNLETGQEQYSRKGPGEGKLVYLAFSSDGERLAYIAGDEIIHVFDTATLKTYLALIGHDANVTRVAFSADGKLLGSASLDLTVKVWDPTTRRALRTFKGHTREVHAVCFLPKSGHLVSGANDGTARFWHADEDQESTNVPAYNAPTASLLFFPNEHRLALGHENGALRIWNWQANEIHTFKEHSAAITRLAGSPNGAYFASADRDKKLLLWTMGKDKPPWELKGHKGEVTCLAFNSDGTLLASAGKTFDIGGSLNLSDVKVWKVADGNEVKVWKDADGINLVNDKVSLIPELSANLVCLTFAADGQTLVGVTEGGGVETWNVATGGPPVKSLAGKPGERITIAAISPDGQFYAVALDRTVAVRDFATGEEIHALRGYDSPVKSLVYNSQGNRLASAYADGTVKIWHLPLGQEVLTLKGHDGAVNCIAFDSEGQTLASADALARVKVWFGAK